MILSIIAMGVVINRFIFYQCSGKSNKLSCLKTFENIEIDSCKIILLGLYLEMMSLTKNMYRVTVGIRKITSEYSSLTSFRAELYGEAPKSFLIM